MAAAGIGLVTVLICFFFVPVFKGEIFLYPYFEIAGLQFRYYGIILGISILISYYVSRNNSWRFGIGKDEIDRVSFWIVLVSFLGARLYYVLIDWDKYSTNLLSAFKTWEGGLSIYGSLIAGFIFIFFYTRKKAYTLWQLLDVAALGLPLGQAFGRLANFFNYELIGRETNLPWKMFVPRTGLYHHPAFLYEMVGNIILFGYLYKLKGKLKPGNLALIYLGVYSLIRFLVEFFRSDEFFLLGFRTNQVVAMALLLIAVAALVVHNRNRLSSKQ
ncbi:MAG: prolipoprotein diacylglyceryl transferase [Candidatus Doudnabacteria bacterium]|nr:prolipoprotein diacylglyceryl transferase [Candidatus Doudnabacteria bacterium]